MKSIVQILAVALILAASSVEAYAQTKYKLGHINTQDLLLMMPQRDSAEASLIKHQKELEDQMGVMYNELQKKMAVYQEKEPTMTQVIKEAKVKEIQQLEARIQEFQGTAQKSLEEKEQQLLTPIQEAAKKAIDEVAKENGYTYVFDTAPGVVLVMPETEDILPLVKTKLGL